MSDDVDPLRRLIEIDERLARLKGEQEDLGRERLQIEQNVLDEFGERSLTSMSVHDRVVYRRRDIFAKAKDGRKADLAEALVEADMPAMAPRTVNGNTLSAWVREYATSLRSELGREPTTEEIVAALPEAVRWHIEVTESYKAVSRAK